MTGDNPILRELKYPLLVMCDTKRNTRTPARHIITVKVKSNLKFDFNLLGEEQQEPRSIYETMAGQTAATEWRVRIQNKGCVEHSSTAFKDPLRFPSGSVATSGNRGKAHRTVLCQLPAGTPPHVNYLLLRPRAILPRSRRASGPGRRLALERNQSVRFPGDRSFCYIRTRLPINISLTGRQQSTTKG